MFSVPWFTVTPPVKPLLAGLPLAVGARVSAPPPDFSSVVGPPAEESPIRLLIVVVPVFT